MTNLATVLTPVPTAAVALAGSCNELTAQPPRPTAGQLWPRGNLKH